MLHTCELVAMKQHYGPCMPQTRKAADTLYERQMRRRNQKPRSHWLCLPAGLMPSSLASQQEQELHSFTRFIALHSYSATELLV